MKTTLKIQPKLVLQAQNGDQNAQQRLALMIQPGIFARLMMLTKDQDLSEDLTQQTLMKIFASLDQLRSPKAFKLWALRIASNELRKYIKKRTSQKTVAFSAMDEYQLENVLSENTISPAKLLENQETTAVVRTALRSLKGKTQHIFKLRLFDKLSYQQIGEKLDCTETMARTAFCRARKSLRSQIDAQPA